jgi:hypothetical protein
MLRTVSDIVPSRWVTSPANRDCEWLAVQCCTIESHCSGMFAHLACYVDTAYPHVLDALR